jgi:hypothetical protein
MSLRPNAQVGAEEGAELSINDSQMEDLNFKKGTFLIIYTYSSSASQSLYSPVADCPGRAL